MSGLYLPCVEMPTTGHITVIEINCIGGVRINGKTIENKAVPVPEHGDLIEAGAIKNGIANCIYDDSFARGWNAAMKRIIEAVEDAPVIIPAEEGET